MSKPDLREWFQHAREDPIIFWPRDVVPVMERWRAEHGIVFLRMTVVTPAWSCLDGWLCPDGKPPDDQGPAPTEADIPVGFV